MQYLYKKKVTSGQKYPKPKFFILIWIMWHAKVVYLILKWKKDLSLSMDTSNHGVTTLLNLLKSFHHPCQGSSEAVLKSMTKFEIFFETHHDANVFEPLPKLPSSLWEFQWNCHKYNNNIYYIPWNSGYHPQGADSYHLPLRLVKAGKTYLNEEITSLLPTGINKRHSQTISNLGHTALLRQSELPL